MKELLGCERLRVSSLVANRQRELSVECVIRDLSPGKVLVDDAISPSAFLIRSPECILIGGDDRNEAFNDCITEELDPYDAVSGDSPAWENRLAEIHPNCALRPFARKCLTRETGERIDIPASAARVEYVYADDLDTLAYQNRRLLLDWLAILDLDDIPDVCLGAVTVVDEEIISCSCLDCRSEGRVEIGVKTIEGYRRSGYGFATVASLVNKLHDDGIRHIGWHCMSTNRGSLRIAELCGFIEIAEYPLFAPYPPIENVEDISRAEWRELASFYVDKGKASPDQLWQAARCWAKADEGDKVLACVRTLADNDRSWFLAYVDGCDEFSKIKHTPGWSRAIMRISGA